MEGNLNNFREKSNLRRILADDLVPKKNCIYLCVFITVMFILSFILFLAFPLPYVHIGEVYDCPQNLDKTFT